MTVMLVNLLKASTILAVGMGALAMLDVERALMVTAAVSWTLVYWSPELHSVTHT